MIFTTDMLLEKYKDYANPLVKIKREADAGELFRIIRGYYEDNVDVEPFVLAAVILSPSYISFETALAYYGLIPERACVIASASYKVRKNKRHENMFGHYEYSDIPPRAFPKEVDLVELDEYYGFRIASKEKALCDSLYKWPVVRSVKQLKILLFEDKRIDEEEFDCLNFETILELCPLYKKNNLNLLAKMIRKRRKL
ncbi:MAG: hypothetical protein MJ228_03945 [Bacilli bacterium]|nr:hypothetical protein [Bacilli bacterium]